MRERLLKKRLLSVLLLPASFIIWKLTEDDPNLVERLFLNRIYKWVSQAVSKVTGIFPFSVGEFCIIAGLLLFFALLIRFIIRLVKGKQDRIDMIYGTVVNLICTFSVVLFAYTILCRVNYFRQPFSYYSGLTVEASSVDELYGLCLSLAEQTNGLREDMEEDLDGVSIITKNGIRDDYSEIAGMAAKAYDKASSEYPVLGGEYSLPKPLLTSKLFSAVETTGIFFTFTMEANVNMDVPEFTIPSTMCHELAHLRGFMREDEANYIAYLVCSRSDDISFRYSGTLDALIYSMNQLYSQDQVLFYQIFETYSEGVIRDLKAISAYWVPYQDKAISKVANKVNDTYLKSNSQQHGVQSYGRMVDLLLAQYKKEKSEEAEGDFAKQ